MAAGPLLFSFFFLLRYLSFSLLCAFTLPSITQLSLRLCHLLIILRKCMTKKNMLYYGINDPHPPIERVLVVCVSENTDK